MGLGFPIQKVGEMGFPYPVARSDNHVYLRNIRHLFSSVVYSTFIPPMGKYSMICESLCCWDFRFWVFSSITMGF